MTTTFALCPTTPTKLGSVATIGYHQPQAWQIVMRIVAEQGWFLVDIRADRRSSLEEWSGSSLLRHFRSRYHAVPELGEVNRPASAHSVGLLDRTTGLAKVGLLLEAGFNCLLLCACPEWQRCHRRQVAQSLQQVYPRLKVTHLVPDACAVDLPLWCFEAVVLLQHYGLLRPLPHTPHEQPVLLWATTSQGVMLPDYGQCTLGLSLCLWMPPQAAPSGVHVPAPDEHEPHPTSAADWAERKEPS